MAVLSPTRAGLTFSARVAALVTCLWSITATGADGAPPATEGDAPPRLLTPTLGRPVFVEPGGSFLVTARIPPSSAAISADLVAHGPPEQRYHIELAADAAIRFASGRAVQVRVPPNIARRTYDLEIRSAHATLTGRHCVAVARVGRNIRIVHVSDMNIGVLESPKFDRRLIDEINLVAPTVIVATGDYLDATHPDLAEGWRELVDFFASFDAPVIMACGDHDDISMYSRHAAPSPIGLVRLGIHRCLVLYDHTLAPILRDPEQIRWAEQALARPGFDGLTFVISHDGRPNLLDRWRKQDVLPRMVQAGRIGLWFAGGHHDWDGRAYDRLVVTARPLVYLKTHQSSAAVRDGADGVSHYRIVDLVGDAVTLPGDSTGWVADPPSTPAGRLSATLDGPNDGSRTLLTLTAANALPYRLNDLALTVRLRKVAGSSPWCHGGRIEQSIDLGPLWECRVRFDLPDKGALRALVGSGPEPSSPAVETSIDAEETLRFQRRTTADNISFATLTSAAPSVRLHNAGDGPAVVRPLIRLDGDPVAYRPPDAQARFATAYQLRLRPDESITLQLDLSAVRVDPGRRELQVYLDGVNGMAPCCRPVVIVIEESPRKR